MYKDPATSLDVREELSALRALLYHATECAREIGAEQLARETQKARETAECELRRLEQYHVTH